MYGAAPQEEVGGVSVASLVIKSAMKYGLDRERCEEELSQKTHIHHGGYYGPWGRPGSSLSSPSASRVTSPIRTGIPSTPTTPVITSSTAVTPLLPHTNATHHVFGPLQTSGYLLYSYGPGMVAGPGPVYTSPNTTTIATSPVFFQPPVNSPAGYGWHPSVSNGFRGAAGPPSRHLVGGGSGSGPDTPYSSREASKSRSSTPVLPNSAPVVPNSYDPFSAYENHPVLPERRRSAETQFDGRRGLFYNTCCASASTSTSVPNHGYRVGQGVPGDTVDEVGPKWACTKCTFINHPDMNKCEMCDYPRFTIGTAPSNHAAHPPNHQGPCYCHRHHTPGAVAGSIGAAAAYSPDRPYSSLPLAADKPSLANILKEKLIGLRDRSDSV
ncbi:TAK1-associated binding protein 2 isoform A [Penaeus vannamei]|uniref:TAK1-associated binding protein 2 isoform A n=1 Tax=Penaeus vannamei TaxID=6689 RepID=A0A423SBS3_PENVA|nr:TAK1-associated binding protein 2 isoform A [Penaeus vannamei]